MNDDARYLRYILESSTLIEEYVVGGHEAFFDSRLIQDATQYRLQTIAESTQRLSTGLKARHATIDWIGVARFRNVLVHGYMSVRLSDVWTVVERDLPALKEAAMRMLADVSGVAPNGEGRENNA